ncbi:hypothetical protein ScPMuIL_003644 [Solemya velum]
MAIPPMGGIHHGNISNQSEQLCSGEEDIDYFCHLCGIPQDATSIPGTPCGESSRLSLLVPAPAQNLAADVLDEEPLPNSSNIDFTVAIPFEEPHENHERSLLDDEPEPSDVSMNSDVETPIYTIVDNGTQKGKEKLIDNNGHAFCVRAAYKKRETTNSFIRQLMSLPFLPLQHIRPAFEKLANRVSSAKLVSLVEYIRRQWIENGTFTRKSWCVYQRTTRTNNYVEGWHRRLNNRAGEQELSFYRLVPLLHAEARLIPIQMQMLKESKLRRYITNLFRAIRPETLASENIMSDKASKGDQKPKGKRPWVYEKRKKKGEPREKKPKTDIPPPTQMEGRPDRKRKVALLLAYCGKGYYGIQKNPGFPTIESELVKALCKVEAIPEDHAENFFKMSFQRAARTDKGVSAAAQVVSLKIFIFFFYMLLNAENLLEKINENLPSQIRVLSYKRTTNGFDSKNFCSSRTYIYIIPTFAFAPFDSVKTEDYRVTDTVLARVNEVLTLFHGTHNFHNYTSGV